MPETISDIIEAAVAQAIRKITPGIQRHVAHLAAAELDRNLRVEGAPRVRRAGRRRPRNVEITKWVADVRARRLPTFVIQATGLKTKKQVVAKYGENATFEKGKPLPTETDQKPSPSPKPKKSPAKRQTRKAAAPKKIGQAEPEKTADAKKAPPVEAARVVVARRPIVRQKAVSR